MSKKRRAGGPAMVLYHFCAAHMKDSILQNGLTLGRCPDVSTSNEKVGKTIFLTRAEAEAALKGGGE